MVVETTSLIECQNEKGFIPLGAGTEGIVDLFNEFLAV